MLIIPKQKKNKKKIYIILEFTKFEYCVNFYFIFYFIKGTRAWYTRVLCYKVLEYHIIFFNRLNSNSAVSWWHNWWGTRVFKTRVLKSRVLEKVILYHLFSKQCFFTKKIPKKVVFGHFGRRNGVLSFNLKPRNKEDFITTPNIQIKHKLTFANYLPSFDFWVERADPITFTLLDSLSFSFLRLFSDSVINWVEHSSWSHGWRGAIGWW